MSISGNNDSVFKLSIYMTSTQCDLLMASWKGATTAPCTHFEHEFDKRAEFVQLNTPISAETASNIPTLDVHRMTIFVTTPQLESLTKWGATCVAAGGAPWLHLSSEPVPAS